MIASVGLGVVGILSGAFESVHGHVWSGLAGIVGGAVLVWVGYAGLAGLKRKQLRSAPHAHNGAT
jgi:hypothetical protein